MIVFDEAFHGVSGLTVVFPGKASLMFVLAREVAAQVMSELSLKAATQHALVIRPTLRADKRWMAARTK
jgi:hypothetical protein